MALNPVFCFIAAYLYMHDAAAEENSSLPPSVIWGVLVGFECIFIISFSIFMRTIEAKYVKTFFSTQTGPQFCVAHFKETIDEEFKFEVFDNRPSYYAPIKEEIRVWLNENWERWHSEERPDCFTDKVEAMIPTDYKPIEQ